MEEVKSPPTLLDLCRVEIAANCCQGVIAAYEGLQAYLPLPLVENLICLVDFSHNEYVLLGCYDSVSPDETEGNILVTTR
jgi:hypothetical protein